MAGKKKNEENYDEEFSDGYIPEERLSFFEKIIEFGISRPYRILESVIENYKSWIDNIASFLKEKNDSKNKQNSSTRGAAQEDPRLKEAKTSKAQLDKAATKIQKAARGHAGREEARFLKEQENKRLEEAKRRQEERDNDEEYQTMIRNQDELRSLTKNPVENETFVFTGPKAELLKVYNERIADRTIKQISDQYDAVRNTAAHSPKPTKTPLPTKAPKLISEQAKDRAAQRNPSPQR